MRKKKLSLTKIIDAELNSVTEKYATSDKWTIIEKKKKALHDLYENDEIMKNISIDELLKKHKQLITEEHTLNEYLIGVSSGVISGLFSSFITQYLDAEWYFIIITAVAVGLAITFLSTLIVKALSDTLYSDYSIYINECHVKLVEEAIEKKHESQTDNEEKTK